MPGEDKTFTQAEVDKMVAEKATEAAEKIAAERVEKETAGLKNKNQELLGKLAKNKDFDGMDPAEVRAALDFKKKHAEELELGKGNFEKVKESMTKDFAEKLGAETAKRTKAQQRLGAVLVEQVLGDALVKHDAKVGGKMLRPEIRQYVRVAGLDEDGDPAIEVVDAKGAVRYNGKGEKMSVEELVAIYRDDKDWSAAFNAPGTGGGGAGGGGGGTKRDLHISKAEAQNAQKYRAARDEAKKLGVDLVIDD